MKRRFLTAAALALAAVLFAQTALAAEPLLEVSELYRDSEFYQRLCQVELSGDYRADIVNVAMSQLGYHEGDSREDYAGGNAWGTDNFIEYSSSFFGWDGEWCAMFVSWCARQAGLPKYLVNNAARAASDGAGGDKKYYFHVPTRKPDSGYVPAPGDLVFFTYDGYNSGHVGLVSAVTDEGIWTVEGNSNNAVRMNFYDWASPAILRYGVYNYDQPWAPIQTVRTTEVTFASYNGEEHGVAPDGDGGYLFRSLYAAEGRMFQLPNRAFCREGLTLRGYYVRRADGAWLAQDETWKSAEELRSGDLFPYLFTDGGALRWDGVWAAEDSLEFHCVWSDGLTREEMPDSTAYALRRPDASGWENPYSDLWGSQWYYADVRTAARAGLLPWEGELAAQTSAARGDLAVMLYRLQGSPKTQTQTVFADLPGGEVADAAAWAYGAELIKGLSDTEFGPDSGLTREQAVTILWRAHGGEPAETGEELPFADAEDVSAWALEAVHWAVARGLLKGEPGPDDTLLLAPGRILSRAEAVALLCRAEALKNS